MSEETQKFGADFKYASIMFSDNKDGKIHYTASFGVGISITVSSAIDVEKLILSCTGLLCQAARALKFRFQKIDKSIEQSVGGYE